jgi:hypothetical protein
MADIFLRLPEDLQRCVMSFVGATPVAEIIKEYYEDQKENCSLYYCCNKDLNGDNPTGGSKDSGYPNSFWFGEFYSIRFCFQQLVFRESKNLYKKYKHIDLTEELGEWINDPRCIGCDYPLSLKDFNRREEYGGLMCSDCYGVEWGLIGDHDAVSECCNNCDKTLVGEEWRYLMDKEENCGMCFDCMEKEKENDEEEEYISGGEENEEPIEIEFEINF